MTWKPLPSSPGESDPKSLQGSLERLTSRLGAASPATLKTVFECWNEVAGPQASRHTRPQALLDGVLTVVVDDVRWANELKWVSTTLVKRLNERTGESSVESIDIRLEG